MIVNADSPWIGPKCPAMDQLDAMPIELMATRPINPTQIHRRDGELACL
ncbi:hypothetical protein AB4072_14410 [Microvirga sp. 2MCAF38]